MTNDGGDGGKASHCRGQWHSDAHCGAGDRGPDRNRRQHPPGRRTGLGPLWFWSQ